MKNGQVAVNQVADSSSEGGRLLGDFIRVRRDRLRPEDFGLDAQSRRRAPGLRREEIAKICGISSAWYTLIEQGRTTSISSETLSAIAAGLRLSKAERSYLFHLAVRSDPKLDSPSETDAYQLSGLVDAIKSPAYVLNRYWEALVWNQHAAVLFDQWLGRPRSKAARESDAFDPDKNLLRYVFLNKHAQSFMPDWENRAQGLAAEFRADSAAWAEDPLRKDLLKELSKGSPLFLSAWNASHIPALQGGAREFQHHRKGLCRYYQYTLNLNQTPDFKLIILKSTKEG